MEERPPIESRLEHLLFTFSSISTPNLLLHGRSTIPRRDSGVREPSSSFSSSSSLRRGCLEGGVVLLLPSSSSCDPAGRYLGTTGHPGGPLMRHDRPWDTGRNAPRSKRRASERSSIFSTRPPRCFRVIRRETTTGFWTLGGLRLAESRWYDFYLLFVFFFEEIWMVNFNRFVLSRNIFVCIIIIFLYKEYERENMK